MKPEIESTFIQLIIVLIIGILFFFKLKKTLHDTKGRYNKILRFIFLLLPYFLALEFAIMAVFFDLRAIAQNRLVDAAEGLRYGVTPLFILGYIIFGIIMLWGYKKIKRVAINKQIKNGVIDGYNIKLVMVANFMMTIFVTHFFAQWLWDYLIPNDWLLSMAVAWPSSWLWYILIGILSSLGALII